MINVKLLFLLQSGVGPNLRMLEELIDTYDRKWLGIYSGLIV